MKVQQMKVADDQVYGILTPIDIQVSLSLSLSKYELPILYATLTYRGRQVGLSSKSLKSKQFIMVTPAGESLDFIRSMWKKCLYIYCMRYWVKY
jgi:hypothetical protein